MFSHACSGKTSGDVACRHRTPLQHCCCVLGMTNCSCGLSASALTHFRWAPCKALAQGMRVESILFQILFTAGQGHDNSNGDLDNEPKHENHGSCDDSSSTSTTRLWCRAARWDLVVWLVGQGCDLERTISLAAARQVGFLTCRHGHGTHPHR